MTGQKTDDLYFSDRSRGCPSEGELPMPDQPFWIDHEYDRDHAGTGNSRYGVYVRHRNHLFAETWDGSQYEDGAVPFARLAWEVATSPVMAPPYACMHPRIHSATIICNHWDGSLGAVVRIVIPQPKQLRFLAVDQRAPLCAPSQPASEFGPYGLHWRDWPSEHSFVHDATLWHEPTGEDVARDPYLFCTAELDFSMPLAQGRLASPSPSWAAPRQLENEADAAVRILVDELNRIVGPVLGKVEEG